MGELSLIEKFRAGAPQHPAIIVGPGSDCAVLKWPSSTDLLFKIDQVVEGTHFLLSGPEAATPRQVGWKAMAKTCSDIAAAGGWPIAAMVALNVRKGTDESVVMGVYDGLVACCKKFNVGLAGGDFSTSENGLSVVVSLTGSCPENTAWTRAGAKPGDILFVTGALGGSSACKHLSFTPRLYEAFRIREMISNGVHACIDITDGLSRDLKHICTESHCGAVVLASSVPLSNASNRDYGLRAALSDGEDFELLLAVSPEAADTLATDWDYDTPLTRIGEIVEHEHGITLVGSNGVERPLADIGYEHVV